MAQNPRPWGRDLARPEIGEPGDRALPVRLLVVAHSLEHGGAEHSLLLLLERLDRTAFDCLLAAPDGPMRDRFLRCCRPAVTLRRGYLPLTFQIPSYARAFYATVVNTMKLRRYIRRHPVDLVLTNTGVALYGPLAAALCGVPGVTMMREIVSPPVVRSALSRLLLRLNRRVIANSRAIVPAGDGQVPANLSVVPGGVELNRDRQAPTDAGLPTLPDGGPLVGLVGTVHPIKGHEAFLRMAAAVARRAPEARFIIVGRYDDRSRYFQRLIRLRRRLDLNGRVLFTGFVEPIPVLLERITVLVITSMTEGFPRVALEAMAAAKPVVAFNVGGVSEAVEDGVTGRLIRFGQIDAMADAVCRLLEDPEAARRMGNAGRARVEASFTAERQADRIKALLLELAPGHEA
ncbi:MAG TPA: glycosyltransferase family 4 protein [Nitrospiria bacterium]|nr:glycosyltransferase family 4 protein [Nitrospiria bacterium]